MKLVFYSALFHFKEKCPTLTVTFFRLTMIGPLFRETPGTSKAKSGQCKLSAKGPPFHFYFFKVTYKTGRN